MRKAPISLKLAAGVLLLHPVTLAAQQAAPATIAAPSAPVAPAAPAVDMARAMSEANKVPDTPGDGPYPALMEIDPLLPSHVVYRPADLSKLPRGKLGVFIWGNGGCANDGSSARQHLAEIASYGYLVIAPGEWRSGPNAKTRPAPPAPRKPNDPLPPSATNPADLTAALDWALAPINPYSGLIDRGAVAVGGFSCGGVQAISIAHDPRIRTLVVQNSGLFADPSQAMAGMKVPKTALRAIHTPVIYLQGGETDIAYANGKDDFGRIDHVPAVMVNIPTGHGGTYDKPMGGKAAGIVVDWLQWQLRGDQAAARTFVGDNCRLCTDSGATIERKNLR